MEAGRVALVRARLLEHVTLPPGGLKPAGMSIQLVTKSLHVRVQCAGAGVIRVAPDHGDSAGSTTQSQNKIFFKGVISDSQ